MAPQARLSPFYNKDLARDTIDKLSLERRNAVRHVITIAHDETSQLTVFEELNPRFFKIVHDGDHTEAVFRMVGAVTVVDMDFPSRQDAIPDIRHKAQHLKIVGFGATAFDEAISNIEKLHWQIHRSMSLNGIKPMPISRFQGHRQIHFKCRFFTTGDDAEDVVNVTPADHVDSNGIIQYFLQDHQVRHGEANRVVYRKTSPNGYLSIPPSTIKPGDIVEVEFSVLGAPSHRDGANFILIHSRVTLLDDTLAMNAFLTECKTDPRIHNAQQDPTPRIRAKRRRLDDGDDEMDLTQRKLARLQVE